MQKTINLSVWEAIESKDKILWQQKKYRESDSDFYKKPHTKKITKKILTGVFLQVVFLDHLKATQPHKGYERHTDNRNVQAAVKQRQGGLVQVAIDIVDAVTVASWDTQCVGAVGIRAQKIARRGAGQGLQTVVAGVGATVVQHHDGDGDHRQNGKQPGAPLDKLEVIGHTGAVDTEFRDLTLLP